MIRPTNLSTENDFSHKPNIRINKLLNIVQNSRHLFALHSYHFSYLSAKKSTAKRKKINILAIKQSSLTYFSILPDHNSPSKRTNERAMEKKKPMRRKWNQTDKTSKTIYVMYVYKRICAGDNRNDLFSRWIEKQLSDYHKWKTPQPIRSISFIYMGIVVEMRCLGNV